MTALLGLLAIAGYQNRDKIAEMLRGAPSNPLDPAAPTKTGAREATPGLGGILGGASLGDTLSGGLRELVDAFRQKGQGDVADFGLRADRTSRLLLRNWNRLLVPMCCKLCPSKLGCRGKRLSQGSPKLCPTPLTNILPKAAFRAQRIFHKGSSFAAFGARRLR